MESKSIIERKEVRAIKSKLQSKKKGGDLNGGLSRMSVSQKAVS